jgi:hypothetical protein
MLALIVFALLTGLATQAAGDKGKSFGAFLVSGSAVMGKLIGLIKLYAPIGLGAYFAYLVGCAILGAPAVDFSMEFWSDWRNWIAVLSPLGVGMLACATVCSAAGYFGVQALWRWNLVREIRHRKERFQAMGGPTTAISPKGAKAKIPSSRRQT